MSLNDLSREEILLALEKGLTEPNGNGCIIWCGQTASNGYGRVYIKGKTYQAHRAAWVAQNGPLNAGLDACHSCDVRGCVNPAHIFPGTRRENMLDASRKGRISLQVNPHLAPKGEAHGSSKLTAADVSYIRASSENRHALAAKFGVTKWTIDRARYGRLWKHIKPLQSQPYP